MKHHSCKMLIALAVCGLFTYFAVPDVFADSQTKNWRSLEKGSRPVSDYQHKPQRHTSQPQQPWTKHTKNRSFTDDARESVSKTYSQTQQQSQGGYDNDRGRTHSEPHERSRHDQPSRQDRYGPDNYRSDKRDDRKQHRPDHTPVIQDSKRSRDSKYEHKQGKSSADSHNDRPYREEKHDTRHRDNHYKDHDTQHKPYYRKNDVTVIHSHKPRPDYRIYKRHEHVYYRTPWYNTRYLAPIHFHYHQVGYRVHVLPSSHVRIIVGGFPYFYYSGIFYRPVSGAYVVVSAPTGAIVTHLPVGFIAFSIGVATYYYVNDTYYVWDEPGEAYRVVEKPTGADEAVATATKGRLYVYPNKGQDEQQQARDRYECHRWAVTESGVDPTEDDNAPDTREHANYKRAISACLEGRDYTVK